VGEWVATVAWRHKKQETSHCLVSRPGAASTARLRVYVIEFISSIYSGAASTARLRSLFHIYVPSFTSTARLRSLFRIYRASPFPLSSITLSVVCNMKGSLQRVLPPTHPPTHPHNDCLTNVINTITYTLDKTHSYKYNYIHT
jgi:hypothetical protein